MAVGTDQASAAIAEAAAVLAEHSDPGVRAVGAWLAAGTRGDLAEYLRGRGSAESALAERNAALVAAARLHGDGLPVAELARLVEKALRRYHASGWRFNRYARECPHRAGTKDAFLWAALMARDRLLGDRQLRRIITQGWPSEG